MGDGGLTEANNAWGLIDRYQQEQSQTPHERFPGCQHWVSIWELWTKLHHCPITACRTTPVGNITGFAEGRTTVIIDKTGKNINPSHLPAITKSLSQTGELASLSQRENDMKKIQSADLKTNIVWLTFPAFSLDYPIACPCHNFLSLCLPWTTYYNGCSFYWNDLNGPENAVWMMGAGVCPLCVCVSMCLCASVCRLQTPFPSAMPNFFHPPNQPPHPSASTPTSWCSPHLPQWSHSFLLVCVFSSPLLPLLLYPHRGEKHNCPLTLIR